MLPVPQFITQRPTNRRNRRFRATAASASFDPFARPTTASPTERSRSEMGSFRKIRPDSASTVQPATAKLFRRTPGIGVSVTRCIFMPCVGFVRCVVSRPAVASFVLFLRLRSAVFGPWNRYKHRRWLRSSRIGMRSRTSLARRIGTNIAGGFVRRVFERGVELHSPAESIRASPVASFVAFLSAESSFTRPQNRYEHRRWLRSASFLRSGPRFAHPQNRYKHRRWLRSAHFRAPRWLRSSCFAMAVSSSQPLSRHSSVFRRGFVRTTDVVDTFSLSTDN
jgi:hypothetical protein